MFRMWVKEFKGTHLLRDTVIEDGSGKTRTAKIMHGLEAACHELDIGVPIWLDVNIRDFHRISKTRFTQDSFIEPIDFDYLEVHIIEEDY